MKTLLFLILFTLLFGGIGWIIGAAIIVWIVVNCWPWLLILFLLGALVNSPLWKHVQFRQD